MGRHRYAGRTLETFESLPADSALAATFTCLFGPDWFLTGRAFVFHPVEKSADTWSPSKLGAKRCWQRSEVILIELPNFTRPLERVNVKRATYE
jgi:hypothetical protein